MSVAKIHNIPEPDLVKRSALQPLGPSVPGGSPMFTKLSTGSEFLKIRTISDDSYDSSSSLEEKTISEKFWTKNPFSLLKKHTKPSNSRTEQTSSSTGNVPYPSVDVRVKKERSDHDVVNKHSGRKKSKRHRSLDAKTARYYAKRQQASWTGLGFRGRAMSSSSDEDNGGKKIRERSPRRKKGAKESGSKTPSRDPSATPLPRPVPRSQADLPPSTNGVPPKPPIMKPPIVSTQVIIQPPLTIPAIEITMPDIGQSKPNIQSPKVDLFKQAEPRVQTNSEFRHTDFQVLSDSNSVGSKLINHSRSSNNVQKASEVQTIEEWIHSRKDVHGSQKMKSSVSMQLFPLPPAAALLSKNTTVCEQSVNAPRYASVSALPWNLPANRHSLSAADESILGSARTEPMSPDSVKNMRQFFEHLHNDSPVDSVGAGNKPSKTPLVAGKYSHGRSPSAHTPKTPDHPPVTKSRLPPAVHHGRMGIVLQSSEGSELMSLSNGNITADSQFLHNALQISNNASNLLNDLRYRNKDTAEAQSVLQVSDGRNTTRWSSDWQINRSSNSGVYSKPNNLTRPSSISAFDQHRLTVPGRPNPLRELNHHELERALEELDEFYESLSAKSEDVTIVAEPESGVRSTLDGGRSFDSGLSSLQGKGDPTLAAISKIEPDRLEYTKQWLHDEKHAAPRNPQTQALATIAMAPPPVPHWIPPSENERRIVGNRRSSNASSRGSGGPGERKSQQGGRKDDYARLYTPTVFTGPALEFQNYPGTNKPQPHVEMDDLSTRKIIHSQNSPLYKVTADLPKQLPSSRNDYATPQFRMGVNEQRSRAEPDIIRDDAAFRQLRNDRKDLATRPQTLVMQPILHRIPPSEKLGLGKNRVVSDSIRQLAKQFEAPPSHTKEVKPFYRRFGNKSQSNPVPDAVHTAVQIDGKRFPLRPPNGPAEAGLRRSASVKQESPKVSPISELDMEKLLLSLSTLSSNSPTGPNVTSNNASLSPQGSHAASAPSPWARLTGRKRTLPTASQAGISV